MSHDDMLVMLRRLIEIAKSGSIESSTPTIRDAEALLAESEGSIVMTPRQVRTLDCAIGHLGAALMQVVDDVDDKIIIDHVRQAHAALVSMRRVSAAGYATAPAEAAPSDRSPVGGAAGGPA